MRSSKRMPAFGPRHVRGVTLIEILVTVVVMSVGLLGVAALQLASLRDSYSSFLRSQASSLADDIVDRMRTNRAAALAGAYNIPIGTTPAAPTTQADRDLSTWKQLLLRSLPKTPAGLDADGAIIVNNVSRIVTVTIQWGERSEINPITFVTRTEI